MLKKENRLTNNSAFKATYNNGCCASDKLIVLYLGKEKTEASYPTRVGFVVSKKLHKRAVVRNRIKRLMRECLRLRFKNDSETVLNQFQSAIFIAKQDILDKNIEDINNSIEKLIIKVANKNI